MAKPYNGHHCWNCWNVSLWIGNDEGLYRAALDCKRRTAFSDGVPNSDRAARQFITEVVGERSRTPDGARYTQAGVKAALFDLE